MKFHNNIFYFNCHSANGFFSQRHLDLNTTITSLTNDLRTNLSQKIEDEIGPIWRQFQLTFSDVTASKAILDEILQYTRAYFNTTTISLLNTELEIAGITPRVEEMFTNVNYLMGRLSLLNKEFLELKTGLSEAIDNFKTSLADVKEATKELGKTPDAKDASESPGPKKIEQSSVEDKPKGD